MAIASNYRSIFLGIYSAGALATLALDFFLGRSCGSMGIASAIVIREAGMLATFLLLTSRPLPAATGFGLLRDAIESKSPVDR
jgi:hypothetical protein